MNIGLEKVEENSSMTLSGALDLVLKNSSDNKRKFKESVEIINCTFGKEDSNIRGSCVLPNGLDKESKVIVFVPSDNGARRDSILKAGADVVGYEDLIAEIDAGKIDMNAIYMTSAGFMAGLKKIASKLGAKGLMPNAKVGTLVDNIEDNIQNMKTKAAFFKSGKTNMIQARVGSVEMDNEKLVENIVFFVKQVLSQTKAVNGKGIVKSIFVKSTMGPAVEVEILDFIN
jgi:large subunit ribosomal protein L1